jgi:high-affinity iron transporter
VLASLLIVFREALEAGLVVGIVLAATQGIAGRGRFVAGGVAVGVLGASLLAAVAGRISDMLAGNGLEVFNASVLIVGVVMLGWHTFWMASHGRQMARELKAMGASVVSGEKSLMAMGIVVAVAILREGSEVVLFLYGIAASTQTGPGPMLLGGVGGIALAALTSFLLYRGLLAIPVSRLFSVTGWLIALLAAGMAGQAAAILAGADLIPAWGYQLWDTSWLLPTSSLLGRALQALVGYSDRPMGVQLAAYLVTLGVLVVASRITHREPTKPGAQGSARAV